MMSMLSALLMLSASGVQLMIEWITVERCAYSTPLGLPVVPEV